MGYLDELYVLAVDVHQRLGRNADSSFFNAKCPGCAAPQMLNVGVTRAPEYALEKYDPAYTNSVWLICPGCGAGAYAVVCLGKAVEQYPQAHPMGVPDHLPDEVRETWEEALNSFSANAYTSSTLMCRKIIFHMAVEAGLPEKNERNSAPRFIDCVDHLVTEEYITTRQKNEWVDSIRKWGNRATHDLAPISVDIARQALEFTYQLLQMVYAFPNASPGQESDKPEESIPTASGIDPNQSL